MDVDWYVESPREKVVYRLDREKAGLAGIREADAAAALTLALSADDAVGEAQAAGVRERIPLVVDVPGGAPQRSRGARGADVSRPGRAARAALRDRPLRAASRQRPRSTTRT